MSHIRNSPVGRAVGESMPFVLPVVILAAGKALYEALPLQYFAGVLAVVGLVLFLRRAPAAEPKVTEDDLSSKSRRAQSIAQELEREAASEHAARERKKSAAEKRKKKGGAAQQGNKKGQGASSGSGGGGGGAAAEDEDEDAMLLRMAQRQAQAKKGGR